jgi:hypothetical protein
VAASDVGVSAFRHCRNRAAAQGAMLLVDLISKINKKYSIAVLVVIVGLFVTSTVIGTNYYYKVRWQPEQKIQMFKMLNSRIPSDKYLLSFDAFVVNQHTARARSIALK